MNQKLKFTARVVYLGFFEVICLKNIKCSIPTPVPKIKTETYETMPSRVKMTSGGTCAVGLPDTWTLFLPFWMGDWLVPARSP